jgi:hypothetical protein
MPPGPVSIWLNFLKLDPAPAVVDLVRGHLQNLGKQTGRRFRGSPTSKCSEPRRRERLHWLSSQYRLFPGAARNDRLDGPLLPN